jgi:hypothetical protein
MSDKAFWPNPQRSNRPRSSASPTPTCAPAAENASDSSKRPRRTLPRRVRRGDSRAIPGLSDPVRRRDRASRGSTRQRPRREKRRRASTGTRGRPTRRRGIRPACRHRLRRPPHGRRRARIGSRTSAKSCRGHPQRLVRRRGTTRRPLNWVTRLYYTWSSTTRDLSESRSESARLRSSRHNDGQSHLHGGATQTVTCLWLPPTGATRMCWADAHYLDHLVQTC